MTATEEMLQQTKGMILDLQKAAGVFISIPSGVTGDSRKKGQLPAAQTADDDAPLSCQGLFDLYKIRVGLQEDVDPVGGYEQGYRRELDGRRTSEQQGLGSLGQQSQSGACLLKAILT